MTAAVLHLDGWTVAGLVLFAACLFTAGWVARGEYRLWKRTPGGQRGSWPASERDRCGFIDRGNS